MSKCWYETYIPNYISEDFKPMRHKEYFIFWKNYLAERCVNIFKWTGLPFPARFIEMYLMFIGWCGLVKLENSANLFDAVKISMSGVTNYDTMFNTAIGTTPITQVIFHIFGTPDSPDKIEKLGIMAVNNQTLTSLTPCINYYANMLAHLDLTINKVAIKLRTNALIKGSDTNVVDAINDWYKAIEKGDSIGVLDKNTFGELTQGIMTDPIGSGSTSELSELLNARTKYLNSFFSDIGINTAEEKRERLISNEVTVGFNRVMFNISDMLESRQETARQIKEVFGRVVKVELNPHLVEVVSTQVSDTDKGGYSDGENQE